MGTYNGLHGAVESMAMVATELGVNALEGGITVGLGLLDTAGSQCVAYRYHIDKGAAISIAVR